MLIPERQSAEEGEGLGSPMVTEVIAKVARPLGLPLSQHLLICLTVSRDLPVSAKTILWGLCRWELRIRHGPQGTQPAVEHRTSSGPHMLVRGPGERLALSASPSGVLASVPPSPHLQVSHSLNLSRPLLTLDAIIVGEYTSPSDPEILASEEPSAGHLL